MQRIGDVAQELGLSADTLRYYEKIGLLPRVARDPSGLRRYESRDLSRLRFIQRAQKMGFSLDEIGQLLQFRDNPQSARPQVRALAGEKLAQINRHLDELAVLRDELTLLVNLCGASREGCPILEGIDSGPASRD